MVKSMNTKRSKSVVPSVSCSSELKIPIDLPSVNMKDFFIKLISSLTDNFEYKSCTKESNRVVLNAKEMLKNPKTLQIDSIYTLSIQEVIFKWVIYQIKKAAVKIQTQNCENSIQKSAIAEQVLAMNKLVRFLKLEDVKSFEKLGTSVWYMIALFYQLDLNKKGKPIKLKLTEKRCSNPSKYMKETSLEPICLSDLWHAVRYWETKRFNVNCINSSFIIDFKEMADSNSSLLINNSQKVNQQLFLKLLQMFVYNPKLDEIEDRDDITDGYFEMNSLLAIWASQFLREN